MSTENENLEQEVLHNNKDIYARIEQELLDAKFEILVASAWFTDDELYAILDNKLSEGVRIEMIISDNQENEKLDFLALANKGASVTKVKNVGYGMMHQKFCIIDKKLALHGSYNWSLNAKKNNHESIIVTNHRGTIDSLMANFFDIKQRALEQKGETFILPKMEPLLKIPPLPAPIKGKPVSPPDYEKLLDTMIAAEISAFDRDSLRKQGFERAHSNNGDHQVLHKALDTLYSGFVNDIDVVEDKKRRLISKIDEQKTRTINLLKEEHDLQLTAWDIEFESNKENLSNSITHIKAQIEINKNAGAQIRSSQINAHQLAISEIENEIKDAQRAFIKPSIRYFELSTVTFVCICLLSYLILFYSSAAYILLYSLKDATNARLKGNIDSNAAEIFDSQAFMKSYDHGGSAVFFIFLFTLIPLSSALSSLFIKDKIKSLWTSVVGIFVVDTVIAYNVAESIFKVNKLKGLTIDEWHITSALSDTNFWLVFVFGALGLWLFKFAFGKLKSIFDERNPDIAAQKNQLLIQHKKDDCKNLQEKISELKSQIETLEKTNIQLDADMQMKKTELESLPIKKAYQTQNKATELAIKIQTIESTTTIYKTHVENDNIAVSIDALRDRINVFLEGWNDFLHREYSIHKATDKSKQASDVAIEWERSKLNLEAIDSRVKIK